MFHCILKQFFNIKRFEIVANEELLFPTWFPTAELLFEKLYPKNLSQNYLETPCNKSKRLKQLFTCPAFDTATAKRF